MGVAPEGRKSIHAGLLHTIVYANTRLSSRSDLVCRWICVCRWLCAAGFRAAGPSDARKRAACELRALAGLILLAREAPRSGWHRRAHHDRLPAAAHEAMYVNQHSRTQHLSNPATLLRRSTDRWRPTCSQIASPHSRRDASSRLGLWLSASCTVDTLPENLCWGQEYLLPRRRRGYFVYAARGQPRGVRALPRTANGDPWATRGGFSRSGEPHGGALP